MRDLKQFFEYLNETSFPYVVLRNWENLPHNVEYGEHSDLDLLVYDKDHFLELFPDLNEEYPHPRTRFSCLSSSGKFYIDARYVGDGYYPIEFQKKIIRDRVYNKNGFFTPKREDFIVALAYHAVHHKNNNRYQEHLGNASVQELLEVLKETPVGWIEPEDPTVGRFHPYFKGATAIVAKEGDRVIKKQISYKNYPLIINERRALEKIKSDHFPELLGSGSETITLSYCGEVLTLENLPSDWKKQLIQIVDYLEKKGIEHRDIRPSNLMVKDGVIKLIDFGWSFHEGTPEELDDDNLPEVLGLGYKPTYGFDDRFSMTKIIKEIEYQLEEMGIEC